MAPTPGHALLASVLEAVQIERRISPVQGRGRKARTRVALARSFLAKAHLGVVDTKSFRARLLKDDSLCALCGFVFEVPSESTFSRAFARFAKMGLADQTFAELAKATLGEAVVLHISRDSTAVPAREKPLVKPKKEPRPKGRPGRKKGVPPRPKVLKRQERQLQEDPLVSLAELPKACDTGTKRNSKGHDLHWHGYKFHVDVTDQGIPVSAVTTSASVHDSQVAIPLMKLTAQRTLAVCYQLMDAGYVGQPIVQAAQALKQVPIIAPKAKRGELVVPLDPATQRRYKMRSAVERFFSDLKDNRGATGMRVRGHAKVHLHLMLGLLAIFARKLICT